MNHLVKRLLALFVARPLRLLRPITEQLQRLSAYVQLASRIPGTVDPSVVILGNIEIEGTGNISLGKNLRLYSGLFLETRGSAKIEIGDDVVISRGTHLVAHSGIRIGSGTMIGEYSSIRDGNHRRDSASGSIRETGHDTAPINIGNRVWIGRGAMILPGITIGDGATVGANAVVTRDVPAGVLVAGVPAKIIDKKGGQRGMNIALVGCGFVADYYLMTLPLHPELKVMGVMDRVADRASHLASSYGVSQYDTLDAVLNDSRVELVLNLTNPRSHYDVSKLALLAGKHVYTEKPLAMQMDQARELTEIAESKGLLISSAPCSSLSETAQTIWNALRHKAVGEPRLVYAEMDDGMVTRMQYRKWLSVSGVPWPYKDEFEVGCTMEHAGYVLSWLATWFGPAATLTSFASAQIPDKVPGETLDTDAPDFSVACIQFHSGIVARLSCSIIAPHDHTLKIIGDDGILSTADTWNYRSPVHSQKMITIRRRTFMNPLRKKHALPPNPYQKIKTRGAQSMDFARGPAELAAAVREKRPCRLSSRFSLHVNEMALAIHWAREQGATYRMTTTFDPVEPMPWAK